MDSLHRTTKSRQSDEREPKRSRRNLFSLCWSRAQVHAKTFNVCLTIAHTRSAPETNFAGGCFRHEIDESRSNRAAVQTDTRWRRAATFILRGRQRVVADAADMTRFFREFIASVVTHITLL